MTDQNSANFMRLKANFVTQYMQLEEPPAHNFSVALIVMIVTLMVGGVVWAALTPVAELAYARGEVVPMGLTHRIQHSTGGRIKSISVTNGAYVHPGDPLFNLSNEEVTSQLNQIKARHSALALESQRISGLLRGGPVDFHAAPEYANLVAKQQNSIIREQASLADRKATLEHEVEQRKAELRRYRQEAKVLLTRVVTLEEKMAMLSTLEKRQAVSKLELLETKSSIAQVSAEHIRAQGAAKAAESALASASGRLAQLGSEWKRELSARASEVASQLAEVTESLIGMQHKLASLNVSAPIEGTVKLTNFAATNAVVGAGEVVMEIIPTDDELLVQALVPTADIGYVDIGQSTWVEFDGYDRNVHGMLQGKVNHISASTYVDPEGVPYYQAEVILEGNKANGRHLALIPGMTAQVEITTGEKSVLAYLGRPILRGMQGAFHER